MPHSEKKPPLALGHKADIELFIIVFHLMQAHRSLSQPLPGPTYLPYPYTIQSNRLTSIRISGS